jgi:hypothetical protein
MAEKANSKAVDAVKLVWYIVDAVITIVCLVLAVVDFANIGILWWIIAGSVSLPVITIAALVAPEVVRRYRQHEGLKDCIEQYKIRVNALTRHLDRRTGVYRGWAQGVKEGRLQVVGQLLSEGQASYRLTSIEVVDGLAVLVVDGAISAEQLGARFALRSAGTGKIYGITQVAMLVEQQLPVMICVDPTVEDFWQGIFRRRADEMNAPQGLELVPLASVLPILEAGEIDLNMYSFQNWRD